MQYVITTPQYNRPNCTKQMLDYLSRCKGIEKYTIVACIEPVMEEIPKLFEQVDFCQTRVMWNERLLGCWINKLRVLEEGFSLGDFVIHLEDDVLLANDALQYFEWGREKYKDAPNVFSMTAYNQLLEPDYRVYSENIDLSYKTNFRPHFMSTAFGMWKESWESIRYEWTGQDIQLNDELRENKVEIFPILSRAQNIGFINGDKTGTELYEQFIQFYKDRGTDVSPRDQTKLLANREGEEFIKLNNNLIRSRNNARYKKDHFLSFWAENENLPLQDSPEWW